MTGARKKERGVALIVALLVVAFATVLIAALLDRGELAAARTRNTLREMQAESYAKGLKITRRMCSFRIRCQNSVDTIE